MAISTAKALKGKFAKTFAAGDTTHAGLVKMDEAITAYNKLKADFDALKAKFLTLLAKLDLDAGVTDTDYAATQTPAASTSSAISKTMTDVLIPAPSKSDL